MRKTLGRRLLWAGVAGLLAVGSTGVMAQAPAAAAKPSIADFFKDPAMRGAKLSPNSEFVAFAVRTKDGMALAVMELAQPKNVKVIAGFNDADVGSFDWVGSERLVYSSASGQEGDIRERHGSGLWSIRRDGSDKRTLIQASFGQSQTGSRMADRSLEPDWALFWTPDGESSEILVYNVKGDTKGDLRGVRLARLDVDTGKYTFVDKGAPQGVKGWYVDVNGQPWGAQTMTDGTSQVYIRDAAGEWKLWQTGNTFTTGVDTPFDSDGKGLRLVTGLTEAGTAALYRLDPATLKREAQPLVSTQGFDFSGSMVFDHASHKMIGVKYFTDAPGAVWLDPRMKQIQAAVDKQLGGRANMLQCHDCLNTKRMLVSSQSDTQPLEYYVYDVEANRLTFLSGTRPWIKAQQMGLRDLYRIPARDGLEFPVLVTQPREKASAPRPAVVLVHGGPYVRGTAWTWEPSAQFLASRGYVVIEPEFRGSTGYGRKLFEAGWKQWGLAMQDDVSDALQWAVKKGWVDPKRVCIAGASYGGYATLMGLIKDPAQYQCGISWVGVTDINYLFDIHWSDSNDIWKTYGMKELVGDQAKDAEQFRKTSPLKRAAELKQPLILAYGAADVRVPLKHGSEMRAALEASGNKNVDYVVYDDEGHGWRKLSNHEDFWGRVERFLDKHIGSGAGR